MTERNVSTPSERIRPAAFEPPGGRSVPRSRWRTHLRVIVPAALALLALVALGLSMRQVQIDIEPRPEQMTLGGWALQWGDSQWALPGQHTLRAGHPGYKPLQRSISVPGSGAARFEFELEPLPGLLSVETAPERARVTVDGEDRGEAPLRRLELAAGKHRLEVVAEGYATATRELDIEGRETHQNARIELEPAMARVSIDSDPSGAEIRAGGQAPLNTPATIELDAGSHELRLVKPGFEPRELAIDVETGEQRDLGTLTLEPLGAELRVTSKPSGAELSINGEPRGRTPASVAVEPEQPARVALSLAGYKPLQRTVQLGTGTEKTFRGVLEKRAESETAKAEQEPEQQTEQQAEQKIEQQARQAAAADRSGAAGGSAGAATGMPRAAAAGNQNPPSGGGQRGGAGAAAGSEPPPDIPSAHDDDIVARQLREAAESESDPELRARLWEEYRAYKESQR